MKGFLSGLVLLVISIPAPAQYPTKPVRMLVGFTAGGGVEALYALVRRDYALWSKVVKTGAVRPE